MSVDQRSDDLTFSEREADGIPVLSVSGDLKFAAATAVCARIQRVHRAARPCLVLDLTELRSCDARAVRAVTGAVEEFIAGAGEIAIVPPTADAPARVFAASGATEFLPLHDDVAAALAALNASRYIDLKIAGGGRR